MKYVSYKRNRKNDEETDDAGGDGGGSPADYGRYGSRGRHYLDLHCQLRQGIRWRRIELFYRRSKIDIWRDNNTIHAGRLSCDEHWELCVIQLHQSYERDDPKQRDEHRVSCVLWL